MNPSTLYLDPLGALGPDRRRRLFCRLDLEALTRLVGEDLFSSECSDFHDDPVPKEWDEFEDIPF